MRYVIFTLCAALVTILLFLVMTWLIQADPPQAPVFESKEPITVVPVRPDTLEPRVVEEPSAPARQPPPSELARAPSNWVKVDREADFGHGQFKVASRGAIALYVIAPIYPSQALRDGTTGRVRVQFTINADGSVSDMAVVDAMPRRGIFDSAALQALDRSHFVPKIIDGVAVPVRAEWTFNFTLTDLNERVDLTGRHLPKP